jgi:hypothetical protein
MDNSEPAIFPISNRDVLALLSLHHGPANYVDKSVESLEINCWM